MLCISVVRRDTKIVSVRVWGCQQESPERCSRVERYVTVDHSLQAYQQARNFRLSMTDKVQEKTEQLKEKLPEPKQAASSLWSGAKPFVNGGASGMLATCFIQPVDMVKVRLQLGAQGSPVRSHISSYLTFVVDFLRKGLGSLLSKCT